MSSNRSLPALQVDMTTEGVPVCQRCRVSLERGEQLTFVKNKNREKKGKMCCNACVQYYMQGRGLETKTATQEEQGNAAAAIPLLHPDHAASIRSHFNQAMRGTGNTPVQAVGNLRGLQHRSAQPAWKDAILMPPPSGPVVITPQLLNNVHSLGRLSLLAKLKLPEKPGYQEAHAKFVEMRDYMASLAYQSDNVELVSIEVTMKVSAPGKAKAAKISNISETQMNIPVRIGAVDLKILCFVTVLPLFSKWSKDYPLQIEDLKLRDQKFFVEIIPSPQGPDKDAISKSFFLAVGQSKVKKFKTGQAKLVLELDYEVYQKVLQHRERILQAEEEQEELGSAVTSQALAKADYSHSPSTITLPKPEPTSTPLLSQNVISVPQLQETQNLTKELPMQVRDQSADSARPPVASELVLQKPSKTLKRAFQPLPDASPGPSLASTSSSLQPPEQHKRLRVALLGAKAPAQKVIQNLMADHTNVDVTVFKPRISSWNQLLDPKVSGALLDPTSSVYTSLRTTITFQKDATMYHGTFRASTFGRSISPVFHTGPMSDEAVGGNALCLKQATYRSSLTGKRKRYDAATQISRLVVDINCLVWADHLMKLVYKFIRENKTKNAGELSGRHSPKIPELRFVLCGLAISDDRTAIYMVEELIDKKLEGDFVKYINNSSPRPLLTFMRSDDHTNVAHFLCFAQHVQYLLTGMAYVSDFQGGLKTLTDPQIITSPDLGKGLFGEGNMGFESFEQEHECNDFCTFHGLTPFPCATSNSEHIQKLFRSISRELSDESLPKCVMPTEELRTRHVSKGKGKARQVSPFDNSYGYDDDGQDSAMDLGTQFASLETGEIREGEGKE